MCAENIKEVELWFEELTTPEECKQWEFAKLWRPEYFGNLKGFTFLLHAHMLL